MNELTRLLGSIQCGDKTAFAELYEQMKKPLFTIILRITRDFVLAEDILQELFLKVFLSPPENIKNPRAYLCKMAHNLALDSVRRQKPEDNLDELDDSKHQVVQPQEDFETKLDIENAIMKLAQRERIIVTLHLNGGLKFREVAKMMEIPLGTVLWSYRKAIGQLRNILGGVE